MSSTNDEWEHKDTSDPLMTWASKNREGHTAGDDYEVECTRSGGGKGATSASGARVVIEGDEGSNGSLGDGWREHDENTGLPRLDVNAASTDTKAGHTIGLTSYKAGTARTLKGVGTRAG
jgi:hypothetical protein